MTTFNKVLGAAVSALLVSAPVAATAAQPVRPSTSLVSSQGNGIKSGIRVASVRKRDNAAGPGTSSAVLAALAAGASGLAIAAIASGKDKGKPVSPR